MEFPCHHNYIDFDPFYLGNPLRNEIQLLFAGWDSYMPQAKSNTADTSRNAYMFHCILSGHGYYEVGSTVHSLSAGQIFFARPGDANFYWPDEKDPWHYVFFCLNGRLVPKLLKQSSFQRQTRVIKTDTAGFYSEVTEICSFAKREDRNLDYLATEAAIRFLRMLSVSPARQQPFSQSQRHWQEVQNYIHRNMNLPFSVSDIAATLHIDHSYLSRISKTNTGLPIREYLLQVRLQRAERYLRTSRMTISEISAAVGFEYYSTFYRTFVKLYGCSPQKYRSARITTLPDEKGTV